MTEPLANARAGGIFPPGATAGDLLGAARQASGLSIDAVAQQLKLAPRQVRALEEDDYTHLPGRTFVRGFIRSYARLVRLDPDEVLGALATGSVSPALEAPTLQPTAPTMGELPTTEHSKAGWTRWAIPLILAAVVIAAAVYEWARPAGGIRDPGAPGHRICDPRHRPTKRRRRSRIRWRPACPVQRLRLLSSLPSRSWRPHRRQRRPPPCLRRQPRRAHFRAPRRRSHRRPRPRRPLRLRPAKRSRSTFKDYSWTEVRDRDGRVILSGMNRGGTSQSVSGTPPLEVVIGNASDVRVTYRGNPVDLTPHTRQNVARFKLP